MVPELIIYAIFSNFSYFRKKKGREGGKEVRKKRGKILPKVFDILNVLWISNSNTENSIFQYLILKKQAY